MSHRDKLKHFMLVFTCRFFSGHSTEWLCFKLRLRPPLERRARFSAGGIVASAAGQMSEKLANVQSCEATWDTTLLTNNSTTCSKSFSLRPQSCVSATNEPLCQWCHMTGSCIAAASQVAGMWKRRIVVFLINHQAAVAAQPTAGAENQSNWIHTRLDSDEKGFRFD